MPLVLLPLRSYMFCKDLLQMASLRHTAIMQIVETVTPVREKLDACLVFPSMPAVMCAWPSYVCASISMHCCWALSAMGKKRDSGVLSVQYA